MDIDFGDTPGEQLATLVRVVRDIHRDFYGNGSAGIKRRAEAFMDGHDGAEKERAEQHKQNTMKLNIIMALAAVTTAVVGVAGIVLLVRH